MSTKRMTCRQCPRYDLNAQRCLDGKANPRSKSDSVAVAEQLGLRTLCHYNPFRDALALRMYFPNAPVTRAASARPARPRRGAAKITVEIEETPA